METEIVFLTREDLEKMAFEKVKSGCCGAQTTLFDQDEEVEPELTGLYEITNEVCKPVMFQAYADGVENYVSYKLIRKLVLRAQEEDINIHTISVDVDMDATSVTLSGTRDETRGQ